MAQNSLHSMKPADLNLMAAISDGNLRAAAEAFNQGADVNLLDAKLISPLITAINANNLDMVNFLVQSGANVNLADPETGTPPLGYACLAPNSDIAKSLIKSGADASWSAPEDAPEGTLVRYAKAKKRADLVEIFQRARPQAARPTPAKKAIYSPLEIPEAKAKTVSSAREYPKVVYDDKQIEALCGALSSGRLADMSKAISSACEASVSGSIVEDETWSKLASAVSAGLEKSGATRRDLARAFEKSQPQWSDEIAFNAELPQAGEELREDYGSVFDRAAAHGQLGQIEFFCKAFGPDWNPDGRTPPLVWSIYGKREAALLALLDAGANPNGNAVDVEENEKFEVSRDAPIQIAIANEMPRMAVALLASGALATGADRASLESLRENILETERQAIADKVRSMIASTDIELSSRGVGALAALAANGWTRDEDFEASLPLARAAKERFGHAFVEACQSELEAVAHYDMAFDAVLVARGESKAFSGSLMDMAAATGQSAMLEFLAIAAGPDWNPDGGDRPIDWAANTGDASAIRLLSMHGAHIETDPTDPKAKPLSPLSRAVIGRWTEAARALVELGADPGTLAGDEFAIAASLFGPKTLSELSEQARILASDPNAETCHFGLRQMVHLAKVGWVDDISAFLGAAEAAGFPALLETQNGISHAAASLVREGDSLRSATDGQMSLLREAAKNGDIAATKLYAKILGPDFKMDGEASSPLHAAASARQSGALKVLLDMGANPNCTPSALAASAQAGSTSDFLTLAEAGADPAALTNGPLLAATAKAFSGKAEQAALAALIVKLPPDQAGFDALLAPGSLPSAYMASLVRAGQKERFWNNRDNIDWSREISTLSEAALADGEAGLAAYAKFRRALAADDIDGAISAVQSTPALLVSLSKRGLADEAIMASLGAGRSALMKAMSDSGWPMEATMRARAPEALLQAAQAKDQAMFEHLLPMAPSDGTISPNDQAAILRAAWKLGGAQLALRLDEQIGGLSPACVEQCRDVFAGREGEQAFSMLALAGLEREASRSLAMDKSDERIARRKAAFALAHSHWSGFTPDQKLQAAKTIASWNEPGFWERAEKTLSAADSAPAKDGAEAFYAYCFSDRTIAREIFSMASAETIRPMARAAQMTAARMDSPELASIATIDSGIPSSEAALLFAARNEHSQALSALLTRVEGSTMAGFFSRAMLPNSAQKSDAFLAPLAPEYDLPAKSCKALVDAGATFDAKDLQGPMGATISKLAELARDGKISAEREKTFSILALRGAIPDGLWMDKPSILTREPMLMEFANEVDRDSLELAKAAASADGMSLRHAGPIARASIEVALAACEQTADAFHCLHPALVSGFALTEANCKEKLTKAYDDTHTINPFRMLAKRAAVQAEERAREAAQAEAAASAKARALDFTPLERAIVDAKLRDAERSAAELALSRARSIRQAFERAGSVSNLDLADLRRVVEKNLPDLINKYASTEPALRDAYDADTRSTPNAMLKAGLRDALTTMEGIGARADEGARAGLKGETAVLLNKAESSQILIDRRLSENAQAASEIADSKALESFASTVSSAEELAPREPSPPRAPKP